VICARPFSIAAALGALACGLSVGCLGAQTTPREDGTAELAAPPALGRPWNVVILNDGDSALPAYLMLGAALRAALTAPNRHPVSIFEEALDTLRFPESHLESQLVALFEKKYAALHVDAVIAVGTASFNFADKHGQRLWPDARVFFQGVPAELLRGRPLAPTTLGIPLQHDLAGMADLALRLRPATRRLIAISGASDYGGLIKRVAEIQLESHAKRFAIEYWQGTPLDELRRRIAGLGRDDAVLFLAYVRDPNGRSVSSPLVLKDLTSVSPAPVYVPFETHIGFGAVAGMVYSFESRGRRMGDLVHEALSGNAPISSGLLPAEASSCVADANELARFAISRSRLPADCDLRFVDPSLWHTYRYYVLGAAFVVLAQAALILALILQRRGRRKAEDDARRRRAELEQASRLALAGELTASIAHEINQPLGAIVSNAEAAESLMKNDRRSNDEFRAVLGDIRRSGLRASEVIARVRALVEKRQGVHENVDINRLLRDVIGFMQGEADRRGVVVETTLAPRLPPVPIDRVQMQQAIVNLCVNAMDAMADTPAHGRRLGIRTSPMDDGGVQIAISDTGPGISREEIANLFVSFFTTKPHGTGLGLSITRSIVEGHDGTLAAANRPEGGAVFTIVLPGGTPDSA
jgi:signal transduction histidine kinase